jgi:hypothetical protein
MRNLLMLCLVLFSVSVKSQNLEPNKETKRVLVMTNDTISKAIIKVKRCLALNGYSITYSDNDVGIVNTDFKTIVNNYLQASIQVFIAETDTGTAIIVSSKMRGVNSFTNGPEQDVEFNKSFFNPQMQFSFKNLDKIAHDFNGRSFYYLP